MTKKIGVADIVVQSNNLVEAIYDSDLTATEHKIIRYAASKVKNNPENFPDVVFTVSEFMKAAGIKGNAYHSKIVNIADELTRKRIKIQGDDQIGWFPWLSGLVYRDGVVHLTFNTMIKPMLLALDGQFTKYSYKYIGDMRSGYTIRLFELLKQYAPIGKRRIKVDTLKKMLGIADKYEKYAQFKLRVLNQAKKELDRKQGLVFEYEEIKQGRKVTELIFYIHLKKSPHGIKSIQTTSDDSFVKEARYLLENYPFDIPDNELANWKQYGIELLSSVLDEIQYRKIDHPASYIKTVLEAKNREKIEQKRNIVSSHEKIKDSILLFIEKNKTKNVIPEWYLYKKFEAYMKNYSAKEIQESWEDNKNFIIDRIHIYK